MSDKKVGIGFGVMILKEGMVLLGKRHEDPLKAGSELHGEGTWTMPGGKLEYGESFEEGGMREVREETGIILKDISIICLNNDKDTNAHFVTIGMLSDSFEGDPQVMEPEEITDWQWFSLENLPSPLYFPSKKIIECYTEKSFYIPNLL